MNDIYYLIPRSKRYDNQFHVKIVDYLNYFNLINQSTMDQRHLH